MEEKQQQKQQQKVLNLKKTLEADNLHTDDFTEEKNNKLLEELYFSLESPSAFSGVNNFYKVAKSRNPSITLENVKQFLSKQLSYSLHKPIARRFSTRPVMVYYVDEQWQIDLVDMSKLSKANKGFKYLMVVIDVFSKYAWLEPLKTKTGIEITKALKKVFDKNKRTPLLIQTDKGTEFLNSHVRTLLKSRNIKLFTTFSERKASVVERLNRTLKSRMWRYFTKFQTRKYIDILQQFVTSYNKTYHRSIKHRPIDVNKDNEVEVWINLYEKKLSSKNLSNQKKKKKKKKALLNIGDSVRISIERGVFRKGYLRGWSEEIFVITHILPGFPTVYKIKDQSDEEIKGVFYEQELQKVPAPTEYRIEKILRKKKDKNTGRTLYLVKWQGYSEKFNSFVSEEDIIH